MGSDGGEQEVLSAHIGELVSFALSCQVGSEKLVTGRFMSLILLE